MRINLTARRTAEIKVTPACQCAACLHEGRAELVHRVDSGVIYTLISSSSSSEFIGRLQTNVEDAYRHLLDCIVAALVKSMKTVWLCIIGSNYRL